MVRYTIRRILWAFPTIFGISVVAFLVTTLIPEPPARPVSELSEALAHDPSSYDTYVESRRALALDLPTFVNESPRDVRAIVTECVTHIAKNERHVILAYAAMWVVAAAFVIFLWRRQLALKDEIQRLQRDLAAAIKDGAK